MSASEKLKVLHVRGLEWRTQTGDELPWYDGGHNAAPKQIISALPQIVAVVEAAERHAQAIPAIGWNSSDGLRTALAALEEALS